MNVLKVARIRKGLKQRDVALAIGLSPCALSLIESGRRGMRPPAAKKLADLLGLSVEQVLFPEKEVA